MENLTPLALGWRRGAGGLAAGVVGRSGRGAGSRAAGVIRSAGSGWKEQPRQVIGRAVCCSSGRPTPPRPGRSGRPPPSSSGRRRGKAGAGAGREDGAKEKARAGGAVYALLLWLCFSAGVVVPGGGAARGRWCCPGAVVVLIGGRRRAPARPHSFPRHSSSRNRSRAVQFRRRMIRQNAAGRRGQILHLTAYRPIGNGELGSMPPYYPP